MATYLDDYNNRKLSFGPLLKAGKMTLGDTMVYQELLYRIQVLETCQMLCKTAPVTTDTRELVGHYQMVDAVLFCAGREHAFGTRPLRWWDAAAWQSVFRRRAGTWLAYQGFIRRTAAGR